MQLLKQDQLDLAALIRPGDSITCGHACAEPLTLMEILAQQRATVSGTQVFIGASFATTFTPSHTDHLRLASFGALGSNRALARAGALAIIPCHVAQLGAYFRQGILACDILFVQLAPPGPNGHYSFGATADYIGEAARRARLVIAEINDQAPRTLGEPGLAEADIDIAIATSRPLPSVPRAAAGPADLAIAAHAAQFIGDGAVLQTGIGATPDAILRLLADRRNLGVHSGMIGDAMVDLIKTGAVTNATKPIDAGVTVTGSLIGTRALFDFAHENKSVALRSAGYTHAESVLGRLPTLVTLNGALEVDLSGQVNAEQAGRDFVGAIGGQGDFVRAGHRAAQGHAIIALPATAKAGTQSRIVARLSGPVTTPRSDVDIIVTEYGAAQLRGATLAQRQARLASIAHPAFRDELKKEELLF